MNQSLSPYDEITAFIGQLASKARPERKASERHLDLLAQNRSDTEIVHGVVMALPEQVATALLDIDLEKMRSIVTAFVAHTTSQGWGFSRTASESNGR